MSNTADQPSRVRYRVLFMLCLLAMITYLDRALYGSSRDAIMSSVGEPSEKFFMLLVAFQIAYALFEIPTGWLGDTYGPRSTLLRIVLWWSTCIALTGVSGKIEGLDTVFIGFTALIVIQFFFGMGEAGAFPNITKALYNWFPASERGSAQGTIWLSARFMGGLTPAIWVCLVDIGPFSWRQALGLFAVLAFVWCLVFYFFFRDNPKDHLSVNAAELAEIQANRAEMVGSHAGVPWKKIFTNRNVILLCSMYFCLNFGWYFVMYFLNPTIKKEFGGQLSWDGGKVLFALFAGSPLLLGMFGCLLGGRLTDRYVLKTGDRTWGRRLYSVIGYGLCGLSYLTSILFMDNLYLFVAFVALAGFFNDMTMGSAWATCQDIGRKYAAIVSGTMNMIGNLGGALTNFFTGTMLGSYTLNEALPSMMAGTTKTLPTSQSGLTICLLSYATAYFLGMLIWFKIDASKPIETDEVKHA